MMITLNQTTRYTKGWVFAALLLCMGIPGVHAQTFGLGDIPLDPEAYDSYLQVFPDAFTDALPASYDARSFGLVTPPKNQGSCGSCWAFASVGAFESHLLKQFGGSPSDLSEQQLNSCELSMSGCCGGSSTALRYWETRGPIQESCGPYAEGATSCPTQRTVACSSMSGCPQLSNRVTGFYTVPDNAAQMNASLYNDGPSYWRFDVYSDFMTFWNTAAPGTVYRNTGGTRQGGHAVLLIGWDDAKQAYLMKNSWGATGGPQGDGTFWIRYSGHVNNLGFQMANFQLTGAPQEPNVLCLDFDGYCNDVKLYYDLTADGAMRNINGYEYGCAQPERGIDGSARVAGGQAYIEYETIVSLSAGMPSIGQWNVQLDLASKTGVGQFAYHYDGYHTGTATVRAVPCPATEPGPESLSEELGVDALQ